MAVAISSWNSAARKPLVRGAIGLAIALVVAIGSGGDAALAQAGLITFDEIKRISPDAQDEFVQAIIEAEEEFKAAGITTRLRMAHFLAQVMTETGGLRRIDENMNYSFKTLMRVFSRRVVSEAKAREIAAKPEEVANWVYGNRLGNRGRHTDDGWNYRGSGFIQLTGRANFRARGSELGLPLESEPERARRAQEGLMAAVAYWEARHLNAAADNHDPLRVRMLVNGPAAHGFEQSQVWFNRAWTRVLQDKEGLGFEMAEELVATKADEKALFDEMLKESGLLSEDAFEAGSDTAAERAEALREFQRELGLPETGELDEATEEELLDPREWRHRGISEATRTRMEVDHLEQTVIFRLHAESRAVAENTPLNRMEPSSGNGETVTDVNMVQEDKEALKAASGIYSEYEMGGASVTPETFVPYSVILPDERDAVTVTTGYPARAVVQILLETPAGSQHLCSGAMVSKDTVLTAAHCLHGGTVAGQPYRNFRVIAGRNLETAPFGRCRGREAFVLRGWTDSLTSSESRYYDLGGLKLDCQIGEVTGWLGIRTLEDDEVELGTTVHGYAGDREPFGRQWVSKDKIRILWELKGFYQNDTYGGTSGSPVYATGTNDVLIGVHTNGLHGTEEPWASHNGFTRITQARLALIREWIEF